MTGGSPAALEERARPVQKNRETTNRHVNDNILQTIIIN